MLDKLQNPIIAIQGDTFYGFIPKMLNRHGLITGATGTGKTVTLQTLAETFSRLGVNVFAADMKGDLSGMAKAGGGKESVEKRIEQYHLAEQGFAYQPTPVHFWDVFGEDGHPLRTTVSEIGPLLLERLLQLNETQGALLNIIFKIADDNNLLLIDLKDLQEMVRHVGEQRKEYISQYGQISPASIGAIQRSLLRLESEGGEAFFGEPNLDIQDLFQKSGGKGVVNILAADKLSRSPRIYSTLLLWLLSKLYEELPEVGDQPLPKMIFFFDEAHLLFSDMPKVLLEKVEQIVRLIRSKGVGIFFLSQSPTDIPVNILGQLGNRVQHALRSYTPQDRKAIVAAAQSFRPNPKIDTVEAITSLGVGEALISMLDEKGAPEILERVYILPPEGHIGPLDQVERESLLHKSPLYGKYEQAIDRESAYEKLKKEAQEELIGKKEKPETPKKSSGKAVIAKETGDIGSFLEDIASSKLGKSVVRQLTNEIGKAITRSIMGLFSSKK